MSVDRKSKTTTSKTTKEKVDEYEVISPLLKAMYDEFKELSKKKPDAVLSKAKVKIVNRVLTSCSEILKDDKSIDYLDLLDEDGIPQNSDVILVLSQYVAAMDQFRSAHGDWKFGGEGWYISDCDEKRR